MACGIGLQKLHVHNWGVVNSFVWYNGMRGGFVVVGVVCGVCRWIQQNTNVGCYN